MLKALTVRQFNEYFKTSIKHDPIFTKVYITGTLSNIKYNGNHIYFSLKEGYDVIDCVIFYYEDKDIDFTFTDGIDVLVKGNLNLNNYSSRINIAVSTIEEKGLSEEYLKFLKMKEDFKKRGFFDLDKKKEIAKYPKNVGLITSADGAAVVDFLSVINQKANDINIKLAPVKVQGQSSYQAIVNAIVKLDMMDLDVIVITRGGGSSLDLSVFNDKDIIEEVFKAKTPIISAIGHKIDSTLLDLVADLSLQTPTEAGSYIIANYANIAKDSKILLAQMKGLVDRIVEIKSLKLMALESKLKSFNPQNDIKHKEKEINNIKKSLDRAIINNLNYNEQKLSMVESRLKSADRILHIRKKNIGIFDDNNVPIYSKYSLNEGDKIDIRFYDGSIKAVVIDG